MDAREHEMLKAEIRELFLKLTQTEQSEAVEFMEKLIDAKGE